MHDRWNRNNDRHFKEGSCETGRCNLSFETFQPINLPHTVHELPDNCFRHNDTTMHAACTKRFTVPEAYGPKRAALAHEGMMAWHWLYSIDALADTYRGACLRRRCGILEFSGRPFCHLRTVPFARRSARGSGSSVPLPSWPPAARQRAG